VLALSDLGLIRRLDDTFVAVELHVPITISQYSAQSLATNLVSGSSPCCKVITSIRTVLCKRVESIIEVGLGLGCGRFSILACNLSSIGIFFCAELERGHRAVVME
jgi:hypothetical protein